MATLSALAGLSLILWLYLWLGRGGYWRIGHRLPAAPAADRWPALAVVVPARNEAAILPQTLPALLGQDYPGVFHVWLVDDHSEDGTGGIARQIAGSLKAADRLTVLAAAPLPAGWTGKLWALEQGRRASEAAAPEFLLFTDADIAYPPGKLRDLVAEARREALDLVSLMVRLHVRTFWERLLIPPFIYFFAMLYPFAWVGSSNRRTAAAAGGCLLLRRQALAAAGGLPAIAGELIDDCALARRLKRHGRPGGGRIWLGLAERAVSVRPYVGLADIWNMVVRTAFVQLRFSRLLLAATTTAMLLVFAVPPAAAVAGLLTGRPWPAAIGLTAWLLMARTLLPLLREYRVAAWFAPLFPLAALLYMAMTLDSARRFRRGRGGLWKGRSFAPAPK